MTQKTKTQLHGGAAGSNELSAIGVGDNSNNKNSPPKSQESAAEAARFMTRAGFCGFGTSNTFPWLSDAPCCGRRRSRHKFAGHGRVIAFGCKDLIKELTCTREGT